MLDVNIEKILPVTGVRDSLNKIIDEVESTDELYVVTKNGKPAAIIVGVHHLEKLTGISHKDLIPDEDSEAQNTAETGVGGNGSATSQSDISDTSANDDTNNTTAATPPSDTIATENTPAAETPVANTEPDATVDTFKTPNLNEPAPTATPPAATTAVDNAVPATNQQTNIPDTNLNSADDIFGPIDEPDLNTQETATTTPPATSAAETAQTPEAQAQPPVGDNAMNTSATVQPTDTTNIPVETPDIATSNPPQN